ncbi:TPA: sialate O-acetylesterase [Escherichia coli]|nr:sialate O-acetylesterase [Escherichia coli]
MSESWALVTAASSGALQSKVNEKIKEGWTPSGAPFSHSGSLMQAVVQNNSGSTSSGAVSSSEPDYYYVVVLAGQSNGMAYGEGLPLPETYDRPEARIKQLARRSTVTPGGEACSYNDIIPADHCLHDVQDMSGFNHPKADLTKGQYGCVGQGLHIAKKLLPFMPSDAGILLVPCCRGSSGFTTGTEGSFSESSGATAASTKWGTGKPLYQDLISRTKAALAKNPKNRLLAVVWMQGENDIASGSQQHNGLFTAMVNQYRTDLADYAAQCVSGSADTVPWICGDTTYYWKDTYATQYEAVYGGYKNQEGQNIYFVPFMTDENGADTPTNLPTEDPDIVSVGYYGAASRTEDNWTSSTRNSHFSSWARRGIIADRLASAILTYAGRTTDFISGGDSDTSSSQGPSDDDPGSDTTSSGNTADSGSTGDVGDSGNQQESTTTVLASLLTENADSTFAAQGWSAAGGSAAIVEDAGAPDGWAVKITRNSNKIWKLTHGAGNGAELMENGGRLYCTFKVPDTFTANRKAMGFIWKTSTPFNNCPFLLAFVLKTDDTNLNLLYQTESEEVQAGSFGAFDNEWHTLEIKFPGGNSTTVTPVLDGTEAEPFTLVNSACSATEDTLTITNLTSAVTFSVLIDSFIVEANNEAVTEAA